jgi:hypothetical protein
MKLRIFTGRAESLLVKVPVAMASHVAFVNDC